MAALHAGTAHRDHGGDFALPGNANARGYVFGRGAARMRPPVHRLDQYGSVPAWVRGVDQAPDGAARAPAGRAHARGAASDPSWAAPGGHSNDFAEPPK